MAESMKRRKTHTLLLAVVFSLTLTSWVSAEAEEEDESRSNWTIVVWPNNGTVLQPGWNDDGAIYGNRTSKECFEIASCLRSLFLENCVRTSKNSERNITLKLMPGVHAIAVDSSPSDANIRRHRHYFFPSALNPMHSLQVYAIFWFDSECANSIEIVGSTSDCSLTEIVAYDAADDQQWRSAETHNYYGKWHGLDYAIFAFGSIHRVSFKGVQFRSKLPGHFKHHFLKYIVYYYSIAHQQSGAAVRKFQVKQCCFQELTGNAGGIKIASYPSNQRSEKMSSEMATITECYFHSVVTTKNERLQGVTMYFSDSSRDDFQERFIEISKSNFFLTGNSR